MDNEKLVVSFCLRHALNELNDLWAEWSNGEHPNLRFGQLVCSYFQWTYPELFYETDHNVAYAIAAKRLFGVCEAAKGDKS